MSVGGGKAWEQRIQEAGVRIEEDLSKLVAYLNDEVVPDVRRSGSAALRSAAAELHRLAEQMDDRNRTSAGPAAAPVDQARP